MAAWNQVASCPRAHSVDPVGTGLYSDPASFNWHIFPPIDPHNPQVEDFFLLLFPMRFLAEVIVLVRT